MKQILNYKGYQGSVDFELDDNILFGKVLFISDTVVYEADTPLNLQSAFEEAVDDYIETCKALGREPQHAFSGSFNVRIGQDLHKEAAIYALKEDISLNVFVKSAIRQKLDKKINIVHNHVHTSRVVEGNGFQKKSELIDGDNEWQSIRTTSH
jgi:predicted HicB family RNase H-like nuclease